MIKYIQGDCMKYYYSIDIGGTFVKFAYLDEHANIIKKWKINTQSKNAQDFYNKLTKELTLPAVGIGICAPGIFQEDGLVLTKTSGYASIMFQTNPILELNKRTKLPVTLLNDAKACGLCEYYLGNAKDKKRVVCYVIGTGIGGCLIDENGVHLGANGFSGEFSYMPIFYNGKIEQLGNHASMQALLSHYQQLGHPDIKDTHIIIERYFKKEQDAITALHYWLTAIAMQLITIHSIYDPECICIGGAISSQKWFLDEIRTYYHNLSQSFISSTLPDHTLITSCQFQGDANLIGAYLYFRREINDPYDYH